MKQQQQKLLELATLESSQWNQLKIRSCLRLWVTLLGCSLCLQEGGGSQPTWKHHHSGEPWCASASIQQDDENWYRRTWSQSTIPWNNRKNTQSGPIKANQSNIKLFVQLHINDDQCFVLRLSWRPRCVVTDGGWPLLNPRAHFLVPSVY